MRELTATERWELSYEITGILAESVAAERSVSEILRRVGEAMEFDAGSFWVVHDLRAVLRCVAFWTGKDLQFPNFELVTRVRDLAFGQGLPGKCWETRLPAFFPNVAEEPNFPRALVARLDGLCGGVAFPAFRLRRVFGVFEFFSRTERAPHQDTLEFFAALGIQIGVFLEHYQINEHVIEDETQVRLV